MRDVTVPEKSDKRGYIIRDSLIRMMVMSFCRSVVRFIPELPAAARPPRRGATGGQPSHEDA